MTAVQTYYPIVRGIYTAAKIVISKIAIAFLRLSILITLYKLVKIITNPI
jgi:hypothetical protein